MNPQPISQSSRISRPAFQKSNVLLVEHDETLLGTRTMLLTDWQFGVFTARDYEEVFAHAQVQEIAVVVISQAFNPLELRAIAEFARRHWPRAGILVVGHGVPPLEDPLYDEDLDLYDESVDPNSQPQSLLAAVEQLSRKR
jgi:DNA-binding NtrC family response regulator